MDAKQALALTSLTEGSTVEGAATSAGVSRATLYRWLAIPAFREELHSVQAGAVAGASLRLALMAESATEALEDALAGDSDRGRVAAAKTALELLLRFRESVALEERVKMLEERAGAQ